MPNQSPWPMIIMITRTILFLCLMVMIIFLFACTHPQTYQQQITAEIERIAAEPLFSWDGELDPNLFDDWEVSSTFAGPIPGVVWTVVLNPDPQALIHKVALLLDLNASLIVYQYFKGSEVFSYWYDETLNRYSQQTFTEAERQACAECHRPEDLGVY